MTDFLRRVFAVAARELRASAYSPQIWVFLTVFLLLTGFCTFISGNLLGSGQADLNPFFDALGWILLIFVPALGMPLWAEELRSGSFELTLSFPGRLRELVLGKYLAGLAMLAIALLLTLSTPLSVLYLGRPDMGAILCGYLGSFLLGAEYLAVACLCSALSRSQTASFLLSLLLSSALMLMGWNGALDTLSGWGLPEWMIGGLPALGSTSHYQGFVRGIADSRDLVYFVAMASFALFCASCCLKLAAGGASRGFLWRGMFSDPAVRRLAAALGASFVLGSALLCFALVASSCYRFRGDLTGDRAYSLSHEAASLAASLDGRVRMRLYFNPSRRMPDELRRYGERVEWLLDEFAKASGGKVSIEKLRPEPDSEDEELAELDGVKPIPLNTGDRLFLGLSVSHGGRSRPLPFLAPQDERILEAELCRATLAVLRKDKPLVGVMSALPVLGRSLQEGSFAQTDGHPMAPWQAFVELQGDFAFVPVPLDPQEIPDSLDCLIVLHPAGIGEHAQYLIDQYLLRGGRLLVFLDPRSFYAVLKSQREREFVDKVESDLPKLLPAWGVSYNKNILLADMVYAFRKSGPDKMLTNPLVLGVSKEGMAQESPLTGSLSSLSFYFAGALKAEPVPGVSYEPLVFSSKESQAVSAMIGERPELVLRNFSASGTRMDIALKLSGRFRSAFPQGAPGEAAAKRLSESAKPSKIILFSDSDMLFNDVCVRQTVDPLGQRLIVRLNDNLTLFQNALESLVGAESLAALRARSPMSRPLVKIEKLKAEAELAYRNRVLELERGLRETQARLNRLQALKSKDEQTILSDAQREQLKELSVKSEEVRREMKILRRELRRDLEAVDLNFKLLNVAAAPALVALFGLVWLLWPRRRKEAGR